MGRLLSLHRAIYRSQRGSALLVFMLVFFLGTSSWILSQVNLSGMRSEANKKTIAALAQAKEALIGRAVADKERPGSLPCPDFNNDGEAVNGSCSVTIGRLPWKTLGLPDLRDGDGNRLWYAMASELRDNDTTPPINPTQPLGLSLDGETNIAAIVFSAGPPLTGQDGRPSNNINDYLDGDNMDGSPYVSGPASPTFNDRTIAISRDQLFRVVKRGVLGHLAGDLEKYYVANANLYPESGTDLKTALDALAVALAPKPEEKILLEKRIEALDKNGWFAITNYRKSATLAIAVTPAITCAIAPTAKPVCTQP
jgi:hypothetical protein